MSAEVWMHGAEVPVPGGLDPQRFVASLTIERRDAKPLTRKDLAAIDVAFAAVEAKPEGVTSAQMIEAECDALKALLLEKNLRYGDSALRPIRLMSKADSAEALRVRIDDKLSRLARGSAGGEDVVLDLLGYLVLLRIAERMAKGGEA